MRNGRILRTGLVTALLLASVACSGDGDYDATSELVAFLPAHPRP